MKVSARTLSKFVTNSNGNTASSISGVFVFAVFVGLIASLFLFVS
jgi:hypothetical protein